jgi:hypothetical protein
MGNLSNLYISQSYQSLIHLGNDGTVQSSLVGLQDGLGNPIGVAVNSSGDLSISGSLTSSLESGYTWVGDVNNKTKAVPTSSFGGGDTSALNAFTASQNTKNTTLGTYTGSVDTKFTTIGAYTASNDTKWNTLGSQSGSWVNVPLTSLNAFTASQETKNTTLGSVTASLQGQLTNIGTQSGSWDNTLLNAYTASQNTKNTTLASYTASVDTKFSTIGGQSGSWDNTLLNQFTQSQDTKNSTLATYTGSNDTKWNTIGNLTGSYATTGSNTFNGSQNIVGAVTASTAKIANLNYPTTDGIFTGQVLQTNAAGQLSFGNVSAVFETIRNGESTTITAGTPLYVSGALGDQPIVYRANTSDPTKMPVTFLAMESIGANQNGRGITLGLITGINMTGYPVGTLLWCDGLGQLTSTRPTGSTDIVQPLGIVTKTGNGGQLNVLNPGPVLLPNLTSGSVWVGNATNQPTEQTKLSVAQTLLSENNTFTGTLNQFQNISAVSASFQYIQSVTGSAVYIGNSYVVVNNDTPTQPYGGLSVYDSGSVSPTTSSLVWDGNTNDWKYSYDVGAGHDAAVMLFGPSATGLANTTYPSNNKLQKGDGGHHLLDSSIYDDGTLVSIGANLNVTGSIKSNGTSVLLDGALSQLNDFTSSQETKNSTLASYTGSVNTQLTNLSTSQSIDVQKWVNISAQSASWDATADITQLNAFTASQETKNATLATYTGSVDTKFSTIGTQSGSWDTTLLNQFTSSQETKNNTLGTYTASVDTKFGTIGSQSGSWENVPLNSLNDFTQSVNDKFITLSGQSGSWQQAYTSTLALNTYTQSVDEKFTTLSGQSGSWQQGYTSTLALNTYTQSNDSKWNAIGGLTGSYITTGSTTSNQAISGSVSFNTLFTAILPLQAQDNGTNVVPVSYGDVFGTFATEFSYWLGTGFAGVTVSGTGITDGTITGTNFGSNFEVNIVAGTITNGAVYTFTGPALQTISVTGSVVSNSRLAVSAANGNTVQMTQDGVNAANPTNQSIVVNPGILQLIDNNNGNRVLSFAATSSVMYNGGGTWQGGPQIAVYDDSVGDVSVLGFQTNENYTDGRLTVLTPLVGYQNLELTGSLTASLQQGYTWVGGSGNKTIAIQTSSFAPVGFATTGSNIFSGNQQVTGSLSVSGSINTSVIPLTITSNTASLNAGIGNTFQLNLVSGSSTRLEVSSTKSGQTLNILVSQSASGPGTLVLGGNIVEPSGSFYSASQAASAEDILTLATFVNPDKVYVAYIKNLI